MTEQHPADEPTQPDAEPMADEPLPDAGAGTDGAASAKGREWLSQLEAMIDDIATQAAPVARQVAAKAAELTAVAAVKAGPFVEKAAEVTTDAGQKLAERAQSLAAELRGADAGAAPEEVLETDAGCRCSPRGHLRGRDLERGRARQRLDLASGRPPRRVSVPGPERMTARPFWVRAVVAYTPRP